MSRVVKAIIMAIGLSVVCSGALWLIMFAPVPSSSSDVFGWAVLLLPVALGTSTGVRAAVWWYK